MKTAHLVASELFLVLLLAGCANLPMDQACRAGIETESKVWDANGRELWLHRSPHFIFFLSEAEINELDGHYESCLSNLKMARSHSHGPIGHSVFNRSTQNTYSWGGQNQSNRGSANDAAHHAAGHTHHHGHD